MLVLGHWTDHMVVCARAGEVLTHGLFREYLERRMEQPRFANGRSVRNAIERARLRQASRLVRNSEKVDKDDIMTIEADDIYASSIFRSG